MQFEKGTPGLHQLCLQVAEIRGVAISFSRVHAAFPKALLDRAFYARVERD
jgi:hypothetical protein